jgi:hypothetical protein
VRGDKSPTSCWLWRGPGIPQASVFESRVALALQAEVQCAYASRCTQQGRKKRCVCEFACRAGDWRQSARHSRDLLDRGQSPDCRRGSEARSRAPIRRLSRPCPFGKPVHRLSSYAFTSSCRFGGTLKEQHRPCYSDARSTTPRPGRPVLTDRSVARLNPAQA